MLKRNFLLPGEYTIDLKVSTLARSYILYIPDKRSSSLPLVVMLHGAGGTATGSSLHYGWKELAAKEGFAAVFPEAIHQDQTMPPSFKTNPKVWNDGSEKGFPAKLQIDDIGYLNAVLDDVAFKCDLDENRIYLTGFSNGASMTFRAGIEMADRVAAIAPVSGYLWLKTPRPARPLSLMLIEGTADRFNPLEGGGGFNPWRNREDPKPSMIDSVLQWVKLIGANEDPWIELEGNLVRKFTYTQGKNGTKAILITIEGHGHEWPGTPRVLPETLTGKSIKSLHATETIWNFFQSQQLS